MAPKKSDQTGPYSHLLTNPPERIICGKCVYRLKQKTYLYYYCSKSNSILEQCDIKVNLTAHGLRYVKHNEDHPDHPKHAKEDRGFIFHLDKNNTIKCFYIDDKIHIDAKGFALKEKNNGTVVCYDTNCDAPVTQDESGNYLSGEHQGHSKFPVWRICKNRPLGGYFEHLHGANQNQDSVLDGRIIVIPPVTVQQPLKKSTMQKNAEAGPSGVRSSKTPAPGGEGKSAEEPVKHEDRLMANSETQPSHSGGSRVPVATVMGMKSKSGPDFPSVKDNMAWREKNARDQGIKRNQRDKPLEDLLFIEQARREAVKKEADERQRKLDAEWQRLEEAKQNLEVERQVLQAEKEKEAERKSADPRMIAEKQQVELLTYPKEPLGMQDWFQPLINIADGPNMPTPNIAHHMARVPGAACLHSAGAAGPFAIGAGSGAHGGPNVPDLNMVPTAVGPRKFDVTRNDELQVKNVFASQNIADGPNMPTPNIAHHMARVPGAALHSAGAAGPFAVGAGSGAHGGPNVPDLNMVPTAVGPRKFDVTRNDELQVKNVFASQTLLRKSPNPAEKMKYKYDVTRDLFLTEQNPETFLKFRPNRTKTEDKLGFAAKNDIYCPGKYGARCLDSAICKKIETKLGRHAVDLTGMCQSPTCEEDAELKFDCGHRTHCKRCVPEGCVACLLLEDPVENILQSCSEDYTLYVDGKKFVSIDSRFYTFDKQQAENIANGTFDNFLTDEVMDLCIINHTPVPQFDDTEEKETEKLSQGYLHYTIGRRSAPQCVLCPEPTTPTRVKPKSTTYLFYCGHSRACLDCVQRFGCPECPADQPASLDSFGHRPIVHVVVPPDFFQKYVKK